MARKFGDALLRKGAESVNLKSFRFYDRMLPMQDHLSPGSIGNLIALPLQGQALKEGNSAFMDENWNAYPDQWKALLSKPKLSKEFMEDKIKEWEAATSNEAIEVDEILEQDTEKPWDKTGNFLKCDVDGEFQITLSDGIYAFVENLTPRIQNRIRELAAFRNPAFYKNLAMGLPDVIRQESPIISGMSVAKEMQSSALIEQWENAIETFLVIDEEAPEYETPTGRRKRSKSVIGRLQGHMILRQELLIWLWSVPFVW